MSASPKIAGVTFLTGTTEAGGLEHTLHLDPGHTHSTIQLHVRI